MKSRAYTLASLCVHLPSVNRSCVICVVELFVRIKHMLDTIYIRYITCPLEGSHQMESTVLISGITRAITVGSWHVLGG